MDENTKLIKCRKCGGNHLTIKCGKDKQVSVEEPSIKPKIEEKEYKREYNIKSHKVKILNLPSNFEYSEIAEFAKDWGHVIKINTKNYENSSIAVIEFKYEREADYLIEALDNTPFEHYILKVTKIEE